MRQTALFLTASLSAHHLKHRQSQYVRALQLRRGTAAQVAAFTGAQGEVVVDTDNKRLVLQDGITAGGIPLAKLSEAGGGGSGASRTAINDANYTILATDGIVAYTALSVSRTAMLCAASAHPTGTILNIVDESGSCSASKTITIQRAGSDTIDGVANVVIAAPFGLLRSKAMACRNGRLLANRPARLAVCPHSASVRALIQITR